MNLFLNLKFYSISCRNYEHMPFILNKYALLKYQMNIAHI